MVIVIHELNISFGMIVRVIGNLTTMSIWEEGPSTRVIAVCPQFQLYSDYMVYWWIGEKARKDITNWPVERRPWFRLYNTSKLEMDIET